MELKVDCGLCRNQDLLESPEELKACMLEMARVAEMTHFGPPHIVDYPFPMQADPDTPALSGVLFLGESSLTIHTYPEYGAVFIDVFHCLPFECVDLLEWIVKKFQMDRGSVDVHLMDRGISPISGDPIRTVAVTEGATIIALKEVIRGRRVTPY